MSIPGSITHDMQKPASFNLEAVKEKVCAMIEPAKVGNVKSPFGRAPGPLVRILVSPI